MTEQFGAHRFSWGGIVESDYNIATVAQRAVSPVSVRARVVHVDAMSEEGTVVAVLHSELHGFAFTVQWDDPDSGTDTYDPISLVVASRA